MDASQVGLYAEVLRQSPLAATVVVLVIALVRVYREKEDLRNKHDQERDAAHAKELERADNFNKALTETHRNHEKTTAETSKENLRQLQELHGTYGSRIEELQEQRVGDAHALADKASQLVDRMAENTDRVAGIFDRVWAPKEVPAQPTARAQSRSGSKMGGG